MKKIDTAELIPDTQALTVRESQSIAVQPQTPPVAMMLQAVIERGVTSESIGAVEQLVGLYERIEAKNAEKEFTAAFNTLQSELPVIVAKSEIQNRGRYEKFEDIMEVLRPLLIKHGFTVSFTQTPQDNRITATCFVKHKGGHSQSNMFTVRLGGRADSETQADCKASTTARRNALIGAFNIIIRQDCLNEEHDPRMEGDVITPDQADELEHRVKMTNTDLTKFFAFAGTTDFASIKRGKYQVIDDMLRRKEASGR